MSLTSSCVSLCAPFTTVAALLLFMLSHMLRYGNWTFQVLAAKHGWEREAKANTCMRGGFLYLFTSLILWIVVFLQAPVRRRWMQFQWNRGRDVEWTSRESLLHGDSGDAGHAGGRHGRRVAKHLQSRRGSRQCEEDAEMSALDWGEELSRTYCAATSAEGLLAEDDMRDCAAAGALTARRFSYFQRTLTDAASGGSDNSPRVRGNLGSAGAAPSSGATGAGTLSWTPSRGLRSRGVSSVAPSYAGGGDSGGAHLSSARFGAPSPTPTTGADGMDDLDFMSDVEVDGTRLYTTPQMRASGWRRHRATPNAEACGRTGLGGRYRAQAERANSNGVPAAEPGGHAHSSSAEFSANAVWPSMFTSLWQTSRAGLSKPKAHRTSSRRMGDGQGPPAALSEGSTGGGARIKMT
ncbi:hypothetical protein, conserved [Leishmania lindenbergi]|uniref:Integral membrane protein n=1 Tax=Leishmania lindenbergi TaxID=651832 RepID=A0AAW3B1K6_9TRYP